jgi:hypothetical protein
MEEWGMRNDSRPPVPRHDILGKRRTKIQEETHAGSCAEGEDNLLVLRSC